MPPEQAQGKRGLIGPGSDVYALGAIRYECLTGRPPFRAESVIKTIEQVIHAEAASPRTLNASVPRDLETICLKCLEKEPHRRYGTAQLFAEDLARFLNGEPIVARPTRAWERSVKWIRRHPTPTELMVSSLVALLAVVGMAIGLYYNAQLDRANGQLVYSNQQLEAARSTLESSNQQLLLTSAQLERSVEEVKAERALARRHLYASRMALIQVAEQKGATGRIVQLLRSLIPETEQQEDLRAADVVTLYLVPEQLAALVPQLEKLKTGSRIVSHQFPIPGIEPDKKIELKVDSLDEQHTLYLWTVPFKYPPRGKLPLCRT